MRPPYCPSRYSQYETNRTNWPTIDWRLPVPRCAGAAARTRAAARVTSAASRGPRRSARPRPDGGRKRPRPGCEPAPPRSIRVGAAGPTLASVGGKARGRPFCAPRIAIPGSALAIPRQRRNRQARQRRAGARPGRNHRALGTLWESWVDVSYPTCTRIKKPSIEAADYY